MTQTQVETTAAAATLAAAADTLRREFPLAAAARESAATLDRFAEHLRREVTDQ